MDHPVTFPGGPLGTVTGVLLIILGIGALVFPALVFSLLIIFLAFFALITSLELIRYGLSGPGSESTCRMSQILMGIFGIILGVVIIIAPYFVTVAAKTLFALWAIVTGTGNLLSLIAGGPAMERGLTMITGLVLAACGALLLFAPALLADYLLIMILGLFAIGTGIISIWFARVPADEVNRVRPLIYK